MQLFPVKQTNSYGRTMINKYAKSHDKLVMSAPIVVDDKVKPIYIKQMDILHKAERFRPSYNIMKERHDDDIVMANLIRDARTACDDHLDGHVLRFRELRQKHPNHMPGWAEKYEMTKSMEMHEAVIRKARKWVDDEPPRHALHYRTLLRRTPFTKGGFPRKRVVSPKKILRRGRSKQDLLPGRRASACGSEFVEPEFSEPPRSKTADSADPRLGVPHWADADDGDAR